MRPQASPSSAQAGSTRAALRRRSRLRTVLLATSALASAVLPATVAHAGDAIWNPVDHNFNNGNNWTSTPAKTIPDGTATFNAIAASSLFREVDIGSQTTLGGITLASDAGDYKFFASADLTFNGAGLSVGSGATLTLNILGGSITTFEGNKSTAGQATININDGRVHFGNGNGSGDTPSAAQAHINVNAMGELDFFDHSSAATATITQDQGNIGFADSSTAGNAFIESKSGLIIFFGNASGGTAQIKLDSGASSLDISSLGTDGTTVGSIEGSGNVFLGTNKNLAVGGNGRSTVFSGVIQDGDFFGGGGKGGSLTKQGKGNLTLTGTNTYTGATTVTGGALIVNGSIESSSGVTVSATGLLAGTGTVSSTTLNGGMLLAGGFGALTNPATFGTLTVKGDLTFTSAAAYFVEVSPAAASLTKVTGTAKLGGATVEANFAPGTYVTKKYDILTADGGLNNTRFGSLVPSNLSSMFKATLSYDPNGKDVSLDLSANSDAISGFNTNQRNVANTIANSLNLMNIPGAFATTLTPARLTQVSGETAVGTQQATFDAMNQFMGVMLDPTVGALSGGRAFAQANDAYASMPRKAPLSAEAFDGRWGVWAAGFGGSQSISGDTTLGSNKTTSNVFGSAAGAEYRFSPNTVAGFALAGGGTHFNVANGGSGNSDLFQAGGYVRHTQGAAFLSAALAYGWQDVTTNRTVTAFGIDNLRGRFNSNAISGRLEGGYRVATQAGDLTPYAAGQFTSYRLPSYAEQVASGANTFALAYTGKDVTATRSELGLRSEKAVPLTDATLMLRGRLAWAHDFNTDRNVQAAFQTLPGSAFVVNGATPAADTALTTVSAETIWRNGWSASLTADAQLSDTTHSYSGKGAVRYNW